MVYYVNPKQPKAPTLMSVLMGIEEQEMIPNTTTVRKTEPWNIREYFNTRAFIDALKVFNQGTERLREQNRWDLYDHFKIPKRSGGLRPIDAPKPELGSALLSLRSIIEGAIGNYFHHPCAFAYIRERSTVDLVKVHQKAESRWFAHFDFSNFFGSTTLDFVLRMSEMVYPLNRVMADAEGREEYTKAMELCFLNGGLPQGTQMSPFITNVMMIPVDHELLSVCQHSKPHLYYTRYADDLIISGRYDFDYRDLERKINEVLSKFGAPFRIKPEKTHYGNRAGRNWILGVMLNKDNQITVGHERKKRFKAMLNNFIVSVEKGVPWEVEDIYQLQGNIAYFRMIEKDNIDKIIKSYNEKYSVDVEELIKTQLTA